ncbi:MAG: ABC transporter ATP-binding protein [Streptosporangiales bacterium]
MSLSVDRGETVALVGESGSGKSLTTLAILKLTPPGSHISADAVRFEGAEISTLSEQELRDIRGRRIAVVFQDPMSSLNPVLTVGRQIRQVLRRHLGMRSGPAHRRAVELLDLVEIPDPRRCASQFPHQLSGGMQQRAMIAIALAAEPVLLIADEPTTALDVTLQAQVMELLGRLQSELGMAMLFISHDLSVVGGVAHRVNVMYAGRIVERADTHSLFREPSHPYTQGLLRVVRDLESTSTVDLSPIPGHPPTIGTLPDGCPFAPRCPFVFDRCRVERPRIRPVHQNQAAACHLAGQDSMVETP